MNKTFKLEFIAELKPLDGSFLGLVEWEKFFPYAIQHLLPQPRSDHFHVLLDCENLKKRKSPFWFENM